MMDDIEWLITLRVTADSDNKVVKLKFRNKHISVHTSKPLFPRKGENKPDIEQTVHGSGIWFLVKDFPQVPIPQKGNIVFNVVCENKSILIHTQHTNEEKLVYTVSGPYELPFVKGVRNINWHAEKHITRGQDNVLIRFENGKFVCARVFLPTKHVPTPNNKITKKINSQNNETKRVLEFKTPNSKGIKTPASTESAKKEKKEKDKKEEEDRAKHDIEEDSGKKEKKQKGIKKEKKEEEEEEEEEEEVENTPSTKGGKSAPSTPSTQSTTPSSKKSIRPSLSLLAKSSSFLLSSSEKKVLKKSQTEISSSPSTKKKNTTFPPSSPATSVGYSTPTKDGKELSDISDVSPIRPFAIPARPPQVAFKSSASKIKRHSTSSPISSSQEDLFTPSPILSDSPVFVSSPAVTDSPRISDLPPPLKRTPSKASPSPKVRKNKALMIMKMRRVSSDTTFHIEGDDNMEDGSSSVAQKSEAKKKDEEMEKQANDDDDFIEEIVVPSKFFMDSDDDTPKPKKKRRKPEPNTKDKGKDGEAKKETEDKKEGDQTPSPEKPKKRRKRSVELIDLEELQKKREAEGFTGDNLQHEEDLDKKKVRVRKETKEKVEEKEGKKQAPKKATATKPEKKEKPKGKEEKKKEEKKKEVSKDKAKAEVSGQKNKGQMFMDLDELDDFEPLPKLKLKGKNEKKKAPDSDDDDVVFRMPPPPSKGADSDMEIETNGESSESESEVDVEEKKGERLKYSQTLEFFNPNEDDDDGETSDYEYSGIDLFEFENNIQGSQRSTPPSTTNPRPSSAPNPGPITEDVADDGQVHTNEEALLYSVYRPKVDANVYCSHPANVVEAHTLASVVLPDCDYQPSLPELCFKKGGLSSLQLETVAMAGMRHSKFMNDNVTRGGYFIGDGTGVGKGRQIAAIFADNYIKGRKKGIWFSVTNTLYKDARRDLDDIGCGLGEKYNIPLIEMPAKAATPITSKGVLFATYSTLVSKGTKDKSHTRYDQITKWCGEDFEGVIVFDEGHAAKNLQPGKSSTSSLTGQRVFDLQALLPKARIVYVSATGATEPQHMAYMTRLGLWGAGTDFDDFKGFAKEINDAGVGAMEMVAMEMKGRGIYCSFEGTSFEILKHILDADESATWDKAVKVWDDILHYTVTQKAAAVRKLVWATHQRFFLHLILAIKIKDCVKLVKEEIAKGSAVVIGLFSTGEALVGEERDESEELFSAPQQILLNLVEKITTDPSGNQDSVAYEAFQKDIKALKLPENPLDKLIDELGGVKKVAEMTGRRKRYVKKKNGYVLESRDSREENLAERDRFQRGEKVIAVISDAASMGISLQSDLSCKNRRQRVHVILQLPWAADKAVQQLGRTHRSHQVTPPQYKLIITDLGGEWRLASTIAARLASLGALTNADRRAAAASKSLSKFLLQPRYVLDSLKAVENELKGNPAAQDLINKFIFMECNGGGNTQKTKRFLNRLLGFSIEHQRTIFDLFMNQYERQVMQAQKEGRFDDGVYDLQGELVSGPTQLYKNPMSENQVTESYVIAIDRGVSWKKAIQFLKDADKTKQGTTKVESGLRNGFYQHKVSNLVVLAIQRLDSKHYFHLCKPHIGHQRGYTSRADLNTDYKLIPVKTARGLWESKYANADGEGKGQRMVHQHIIVGSILPIFSRLVMSLDGDKIQIVRAKCGEKRLVGVHVHEDYIKVLLQNLALLEHQVRGNMRKKQLVDHLATQGIVLRESLEALPIESLVTYLGTSNEHPQRGKRKLDNNDDISITSELELQQAKNYFAASLASHKSIQSVEQVAKDIIAYVHLRSARYEELNSLISATGVPLLTEFNPNAVKSFLRMGGTTASSVVEMLKANFNAHAPRLSFLHRTLAHVPQGVNYNQVLEFKGRYKKEFPQGPDILATLQLPTVITRTQFIKMDTLIWCP